MERNGFGAADGVFQWYVVLTINVDNSGEWHLPPSVVTS